MELLLNPQDITGLIITVAGIVISLIMAKKLKKGIRIAIMSTIVLSCIIIACLEKRLFGQDQMVWFTRSFIMQICTIGYLARVEYYQKNGEHKVERIQEN